MGSDLKNGGHSWLLVCFFFVFVVLAECQDYDPAEVLNCTYVITIDTSCTEDAATIHPVYIRFGDKDGNRAVIRPVNAKLTKRIIPIPEISGDNAPPKPFQNCTVDEYTVNRLCVESPICYVFLKLMDEIDNWRVGWVQVQITREGKNDHLSTQRFQIRQYLPPKKWYGYNECVIDPETAASEDAKRKKKGRSKIFFNGKRTSKSSKFPF